MADAVMEPVGGFVGVYGYGAGIVCAAVCFYATLRSCVNDKEESLRFSNLVTVDVPASPTAAVASARTLEARTYFVAGSGGRRSYLLTAWVSSPLEVGRCERAPCGREFSV